MEYLFALSQNGFCLRIDHALGVGDLGIIHRNTALLYQPACFAVGRGQSAAYHQGQDPDAAVGNKVLSEKITSDTAVTNKGYIIYNDTGLYF